MEFEKEIAETRTVQDFKRVKVSRDLKTGEIVGWKEFYELICMEECSGSY